MFVAAGKICVHGVSEPCARRICTRNIPRNARKTPTYTVTALHYRRKNDADRIDRAKKIVPKMARFAPFSERRRRKFCQNDHENGKILRHTTSSRPYERRSSAFGHVIFSLAAAQITHLLSCRPPNQCGARHWSASSPSSTRSSPAPASSPSAAQQVWTASGHHGGRR